MARGGTRPGAGRKPKSNVPAMRGSVGIKRDDGNQSGPLAISYRSLKSLTPYTHNARTHSPQQILEIANSIERFGFVNPVLIDEEGIIIAGHGRVAGAERAGLGEVPTIVIRGLSGPARRALALADNRIALNSGWDMALLKSEIESLEMAGEELDGLGFEADEIDALFKEGGIEVLEIKTGDVQDRFWISIRGPLVDQAAALLRLQGALAGLKDVEIELGTIAVDGLE